jgi:hypothetical protein
VHFCKNLDLHAAAARGARAGLAGLTWINAQPAGCVQPDARALQRFHRSEEPRMSAIEASAEAKEVRAAWARARASWRRTERALQALMDANGKLMGSLRKAGTVAATDALKQLQDVILKLEGGRQRAHGRFARLARTHRAAGTRKAAHQDARAE